MNGKKVPSSSREEIVILSLSIIITINFVFVSFCFDSFCYCTLLHDNIVSFSLDLHWRQTSISRGDVITRAEMTNVKCSEHRSLQCCTQASEATNQNRQGRGREIYVQTPSAWKIPLPTVTVTNSHRYRELVLDNEYKIEYEFLTWSVCVLLMNELMNCNPVIRSC